MKAFTLTVLLFFISTIAFGQNNISTDSLYQEIKGQAKKEYSSLSRENPNDIKKLDSLDLEYAKRYQAFYENYKDTETGKEALKIAFSRWLNVDSLEVMQRTLNEISVNDKHWVDLSEWIRHAYSNRRMLKEYTEYLASIRRGEVINNPVTESYISFRIAKYHFKYGDQSIAEKEFKKVIDLNADSIKVEQSKRELYDIASLTVGNQAPNFKSKSLTGEEIELRNLKGKFVFIEFWATWCGPCIPEIPYLKAVYEKFGSRNDFVMIGISLDQDEDKLRDFIDDHDINWLQIKDENPNYKWDGKIAHLFAVGNGIPKSYLLDKEGKIIATELRKERLIEELNKYFH